MTNEDDSRTAVIGSLRVEDDHGVVRVEARYDSGIAEVWSAVSDPARLGRWVAEVSGDIRPGGAFTATFTSGWDGVGRIETCDAPHHLVVTTWDDDSEPTTIDAVLTEDGEGSILVLEERGLPLDEYAAHGSGWQAHLEDLGAHLDGRTPGPWLDRWKELTPDYEAKL